MRAAALIRAANGAGVQMEVADDRLVLSAAKRPEESLLAELRASKAEILLRLRQNAEWSEEDWQALFDERAAIMEFDGGLPRAEAEALATEEINGAVAIARRAADD